MAIILTIFLSNSIYGLASPFLPVVLDEVGVSETWTGLIFASYAIAGTIVSPIVGKVMDKVGHKKIMAAGSLLMSLACTSFGFVEYIHNNTIIIICGILIRFLQGTASSMINTTAYSFAALAYPDKVDKLMGMFEGTAGIATTFSPVMGSIIYNLAGF